MIPASDVSDPFAMLDLGPADAVAIPAAAAAVPAAAAETAAAADSGAAVDPVVKASKRGSKKCRIAYFDLETVPDLSRIESYDLPPIPGVAGYIPAESEPSPTELVRPTVDETKSAVESVLSASEGKKFRRELAEKCIEIENSSRKPRKGVIDIFAEMISAIDNKAKMIADAHQANCKAMSVCPEMNQIVAFGWAVDGDPVQSLVAGDQKADGTGVITEVDILNRIWMVLSSVSGPVCGFGVLGFDIPTIYVRSAILKVKPRRSFDLKSWGKDVLDLMVLRYPKSNARGLGWLAKVNGIQSKLPDVDGSHVASLHAAGDYAKVGEYVRDDVELVRSYHQMYSGTFWPA